MLIIISSLWYFIIASKTSQARADFIGRNACGAWDTAQQERASADKSQFQACEPHCRKQRADCPRLSSASMDNTILRKIKRKRNTRTLYTKANAIFPNKTLLNSLKDSYKLRSSARPLLRALSVISVYDCAGVSSTDVEVRG